MAWELMYNNWDYMDKAASPATFTVRYHLGAFGTTRSREQIFGS
jgi:hypothetical protein